MHLEPDRAGQPCLGEDRVVGQVHLPVAVEIHRTSIAVAIEPIAKANREVLSVRRTVIVQIPCHRPRVRASTRLGRTPVRTEIGSITVGRGLLAYPHTRISCIDTQARTGVADPGT